MTWFEEWFDKNYLELYSNRDPSDALVQADLISKKLEKPDGRWLDVGCGTGRYTAIFKEKGYNITGIDISRILIEEGKKKHPELDIRLASLDDLLQQPPPRYRVILSLFTSFGYYNLDEDNLTMLKKMGDLSELGGYLWFDFLNAKKILQEPLTDTVNRTSSGKIYHQFRRVRIDENRGSRVEKEIKLYDENAQYLKTYHESVRLYTLEDFRELLPQAGFEIKKVFGDYQGGAYESNSPRLIIWGQKSR